MDREQVAAVWEPSMIAAIATLLALAAQPGAAPAPSTAAGSAVTWPALGAEPGGRWACDPEHERWRQADVALLRADMPKGLAGAGADLPALEAALAHAPTAAIGGSASCAGQLYAFNDAAALVTMVTAAKSAAPSGATVRVSVQPRPMPYADLALLVGSLRNEARRPDLAIAALDRGLAVEPGHPRLSAEKAFALNRIGRSAEAAQLCADALAANRGGKGIEVARLHRTRGYALGELGRYDEAIAEYRTSQALDPAETVSANEIVYLQGRKAGRGPAATKSFTTDQLRKPPA